VGLRRYYSRDELPGTSVFVRNLPQDVTEEKLEAAFKDIGALRGPKPINLKIQKGKESFAFVDFEDSAAQQAAIAGPILVDGHQVRAFFFCHLHLSPRRLHAW
jgi:RNA recognition motif-containing protein